MLSSLRCSLTRLGLVSVAFLTPYMMFGQTPATGARRIIGFVDDHRRTVLRGQRHPLARSEFDRGEAPPDTRMEQMVLTLRADEGQQRELEALIEAQQDPESPDYHRWITPAEWLRGKGFDVESVAPSRRLVVFSGTAAQVSAAFYTPIHLYRVRGVMHHANAADPQIPEALAAVVGGVVSLHDFRSQPQHNLTRPALESSPEFTSGSAHYLSPADFATIYNLGPLYAGSIDGRGQSIAIVGRSNINLSDVQTFQSRFGLPANPPQVIVNGTVAPATLRWQGTRSASRKAPKAPLN